MPKAWEELLNYQKAERDPERLAIELWEDWWVTTLAPGWMWRIRGKCKETGTGVGCASYGMDVWFYLLAIEIERDLVVEKRP